MALDRKDVRAKLDPDVHAALVVILDADGTDIAAYIESELVKFVSQRVHAAKVIAAGTAGLEIPGIIRDSSGTP
jgi:hypothetical protein